MHRSAKDFLLDKATEKLFPHGKEKVHHNIFARSVRVLSKTLQRDMYGLSTLESTADPIKQPDPDPLEATCYSCIYWIDHLYDSSSKSIANYEDDLQDGGVVDIFLRKKYLYWLEGLSLCKSLSKGVISIEKLWSLAQV